MKILEVLDSFYPNVDGPVNVVENIAKTLNELNLAVVDILVPNYPNQNKQINNINIFRCPSLPSKDGYRACVPFINNKVKNIIKNGHYDLIHVHSPFPLGKYAIKIGKKLGIPTLITIHTKYRDDFERLLKFKFLQKFMLNYIMKAINKADYVLSVSQGAAQTLREYGYKGENITVIPNGTDMIPTKVNDDKLNDIKIKYGLENNFIFLTVGRIVSLKNIQFSLTVLKKLKDLGVYDFKFLIVGDGEYKPTLEKLVKEYELANNVIFTGKIYDRDELASLYQVSDLFLFPSTFDTCGIVVIEAAANFLPSVVAEKSCPSEMIENNVSGFEWKLDSNIWAKNLVDLVNNKGKLQNIKANVVDKVYINWKDVARIYLEFYKKVLKKDDDN